MKKTILAILLSLFLIVPIFGQTKLYKGIKSGITEKEFRSYCINKGYKESTKHYGRFIVEVDNRKIILAPIYRATLNIQKLFMLTLTYKSDILIDYWLMRSFIRKTKPPHINYEIYIFEENRIVVFIEDVSYY